MEIHCSHCNKKTNIIFFCKCGVALCIQHRFHNTEECQKIYKEKFKEQLSKDNQKISSNKMHYI